MTKSKTTAHRPDLLLLGLVLGLLGFGTIMIFDASVVSASRDFGDKYYYLKEQIKWIVIGLMSLGVTMRIDYHFYRRLALPIMIGTLVSLVMVFFPGIGLKIYGANRWLNFGAFIVQPAELAKLSLAIFLAAWLEKKADLQSFRRGLLPVLVLLVLLGGLLLLQPDLGTFIIIALLILIVYFVAGAKLFYYALGLPLILGSGLLVILASSYRKDRLLTFLDPTVDPQGKSYHINQVLLALGSGGLFGSGIGQSRGKYEYLPEVTTDSIFAVIGEELGYIGALALIAVFAVVIYRGFLVVRAAPDRFGQLLALGIISSFAVQLVLNLASMVVLVPLTGVPLPLISYGGSSLVVSLASFGILLNISRFHKS